MISTERDYLNVKGQQCQPIHCKRFHSPNDSLISINQVPSLPQLKLQAKQFLSQSIHKEILGAPSLTNIHVKPLICKNKSCIFLVRNLEDKIAKYILRIREIVKENNMLRTKLQMERVTIDSYIPSTHRSQKSSDYKSITEELSQLRSNIVSIHDSYQFAKFHNEVVVTNLTKQIHQVYSNLSYSLSQPILDLNWNKPAPSSQKPILSNICQKCNLKNNNNSQMIELECGHYYHSTCFCEHISQNQTNQWCQCREKIKKTDQQQLGQAQLIILREIKNINQLAQLVQKQESFQFYKCEQSNCSFIILSEFENQISLRSFCQSCLVMRYFYKQETIEK